MSDVPIFYNLQTAGDVTAITGKLSDLETTVNTNLVAAINEIDGKFPVSVANGGTGQTTFTSGNILVGNGTAGIDSISTIPLANGGTGGTTATEARTNLSVLTPVTLYGNASGETGTVILNDTVGNYTLIEITAKNGDGSFMGFQMWNDYSNAFNGVLTIPSAYMSGSEYRISLKVRQFSISGDTITWTSGSYANLKSSSPYVSTAEEAAFGIYKVVGYKY